MDWEEHKQLAESSRRLIAFPFFLEALSSAQSPCLDIGCGTADLTEIVAKRLNFSIVGVDKSISIEDRRRCVDSDVHLVEADITKNGVLETGTSYNSAFSNCCFCHLNDDQLITSLADLFNTMNTDGKFVFLVPSISWARSLYQDIEYVSSGITATPRSGERQFFRTPNWYASALQKAGFVNIETFEVLIPNDERLDRRYLERAGQPIFSAFIASRGEFIPDLALRTKAFDVAHDNRKLEIQLFWQRSLFFWGFVAASLVGYAQTIKDFPQYSIVFSLFGLVCSIVWSRGNRGSKYWQEYWRKKSIFSSISPQVTFSMIESRRRLDFLKFLKGVAPA